MRKRRRVLPFFLYATLNFRTVLRVMRYNGHMVVVGMDEVGRGALAGPVFVGAVVLEQPMVGVRDSKLLTPVARQRLARQIARDARAWAIGYASAQEIDDLGLTAALRLAYQRTITAMLLPYESIIIDGNYNFLAALPAATTLVKADQTVPAVSAASIIAKVARDARMAQAAAEHPVYGFERHVGYGTADHLAAIAAAGPCALHRRSFAPFKQTAGAAA